MKHEKKITNNEEASSEKWVNLTQLNVGLNEVSERKGQEKLFEKAMAKNFQIR